MSTWPLPPDTWGSDGRLARTVEVPDPDGSGRIWLVHVVEAPERPGTPFAYVCVPSNGDEVEVVPHENGIRDPGSAVSCASQRAARVGPA